MFDYFDKTVTKKQEKAIDQHLPRCRHCSAFYSQEQRYSSFIGEVMENITSSLCIDSTNIERPNAVGRKQGVSIKRYFYGGWRLAFKPVAVLLVLCIIPAIIWLISVFKPGPGEMKGSDLPISRYQAILTAADLPLTDPLKDWYERRLVITIYNQDEKIIKQIITSESNEEVILYKKINNGGMIR